MIQINKEDCVVVSLFLAIKSQEVGLNLQTLWDNFTRIKVLVAIFEVFFCQNGDSTKKAVGSKIIGHFFHLLS